MENTKPKLKLIVKSKMEITTQLKMLCKKFLWSPHRSDSLWIALNNWCGLNKIPWRKYEIVWSKSITREPARAVGKSPVILPIIKPANTCVGKVILEEKRKIKIRRFYYNRWQFFRHIFKILKGWIPQNTVTNFLKTT